jgi:hypothetical protein
MMTRLLQQHFKKIGLTLFVTFFCIHNAHAGTLSCSVVNAASCTTGTVIYRMSSTSNAHAELANETNSAYDNTVVCCTNVIGLHSICAGTFAIALKLSSTSNAHTEENSQSTYSGDNACIGVPGGGSVSLGYQATNCNGYDTTLGSIEASTNAHVGDAGAYTTKICATASGVPQTLSFSISDSSIGFGSLSSVQTRYATSDTQGNTSDSADAHTISIATNASGGYVLSLSGNTLISGIHTVTPIGASATTPSIGTEQFGMRMSINSGSGVSTSPYNGANWALDTGAFPDTVATGAGDSVTTVFGVRYMSNIAALTEVGSYTSTLTYTVTATF